MTPTWRGWLIVGATALPAIAGAILLLARALDTSGASGVSAADDPLPPAIYARQLCSFANDDAQSALIQGADGGLSVVVGDKTWWLFGDTLFLAQSGKQIEQNSIAWSDSLRPDGCPLLHYYAPSGIALPFLPKDGSLTVWPVGAWAVSDHSFDFYTAYVYGSGPYAYSIGEVGLAQLDTTTMQVTVLARKLWDADSGFRDQVINTQPIDLDEAGRLRVVLHTKDSLKLLARVRPDALANAAAYEYWDGSGWTPSTGAAVSLWQPPSASAKTDIQRLATFENGASVAWDAALGKYVAVLNVGPNAIGARTAARLEGPWSEPVRWLDCLTFAESYVPTCYSPFQHPQLSADGHNVLITLTRFKIYDTAMFDVRLGTAIHEYRRGEDAAYARSSPGGGWSDDGIAFYASDAPQPGFVPVYGWRRGDERRFAASDPGGGFDRGDVAFYTPPAPSVDGSLTVYRPVYEWTKGTSHLLSRKSQGLEPDGYTRGGAAFYAP